MQKLIESVGALSAKERKALAVLLKQKGINLFGVAPIFKRDADEPLLLSYAQQRQWFLWQLEPDSAAYNLSKALRLTGSLNLDALNNSLAGLMACHESLRTTFVQDADRVLQCIAATGGASLVAEAHEARWAAEGEAGLQAVVEAEIAQPFDLATGPLIRARLLRLAEDQHVLVLTLHHSICDGASLQVMVNELVQLYAAFSQGHPAQLPALPVLSCRLCTVAAALDGGGGARASIGLLAGPVGRRAAGTSCPPTMRAQRCRALPAPRSTLSWALSAWKRSSV